MAQVYSGFYSALEVVIETMNAEELVKEVVAGGCLYLLLVEKTQNEEMMNKVGISLSKMLEDLRILKKCITSRQRSLVEFEPSSGRISTTKMELRFYEVQYKRYEKHLLLLVTQHGKKEEAWAIIDKKLWNERKKHPHEIYDLICSSNTKTKLPQHESSILHLILSFL